MSAPGGKTPDRAILLTAAITVIVGIAMVDQLELLTSMVNFGALTGFLALHLSVMVYFIVCVRRAGNGAAT